MQSLGKPSVMPAEQTERKALQHSLRPGSAPSLPSATPHQEPGRSTNSGMLLVSCQHCNVSHIPPGTITIRLLSPVCVCVCVCAKATIPIMLKLRGSTILRS